MNDEKDMVAPSLDSDLKNGTEAVILATRSYVNSSGISDDHVLVNIDFKNAFNSVRRCEML